MQNTLRSPIYHEIGEHYNTNPRTQPLEMYDNNSNSSGYSMLGPETRNGDSAEDNYTAPNAQVWRNIIMLTLL